MVEFTRTPLLVQLSLYTTSALVSKDVQETVAVDDVLPICLKLVGTGGVPTSHKKLSYLCKQESEGSQLLLSDTANTHLVGVRSRIRLAKLARQVLYVRHINK